MNTDNLFKELIFTLNNDNKSYSVELNENIESSPDIIIPDTYNDLPVTIIASHGFSHCDNIKSVTMPDTITLIDVCAFFFCRNLTTIKLSKNLEVIGDMAFSHCDNLTSIDIPDSVTEIKEDAFSWSQNLKSINISKNVKKIEDNAFTNCDSLKNIFIPEGVTHIGKNVFALCDNIRTVSLPETLISIGKEAFIMCKSLHTIYIPKSVKEIGDYAFGDCPYIREVYYGGSKSDKYQMDYGYNGMHGNIYLERGTWFYESKNPLLNEEKQS